MNPSTPALEARSLAHSFKEHRALVDVSFEVERRSIHGFVGPNGAGKTTTLKVLATLLKPQLGIARVCGLDVVRRRREVRSSIGFMPDHFSMYRQMTVAEYLDFFGAAYGIGFDRRTRIIEDVLELTDMAGRRDDLIRTLSRGMQQRVSLARVLVNDPEVLLLDEPASGLDPRSRIELMAILRELRDMGKTVFISSHILSELGDLCDSVTIIDRGEIRYSGEMGELLERGGESRIYRLRVADLGEREAFLAALQAHDDVAEATAEESDSFLLNLVESSDGNGVLRTVLDAGVRVVAFDELRRHLNEAFLDLTEPGVRP